MYLTPDDDSVNLDISPEEEKDIFIVNFPKIARHQSPNPNSNPPIRTSNTEQRESSAQYDGQAKRLFSPPPHPSKPTINTHSKIRRKK
ncbi:uncharacterized protein EAF01_008142 [Botrytis porri]|uniref:uncharacterized protein n=1 Tax=Botrytis porri TaxID=87229 RepID=UPI001901A876|nr:uncharacterized protein EAF01_008142 [Botrytis porri]KAF7898929.1 hypothetical protein EAF01_008142 [Botrytis porri]